MPSVLLRKVEPTLISSSLVGVLAQRLVRTICPECRESYTPQDEVMREFFNEPPSDMTWYRGRGCEQCNFSGYRGRRVVAELWTPNHTDIILINKSAPFEELRASSVRSTFSMVDSALCLLREGRTNLEELIRMLPYSTVYRFRDQAASHVAINREVESVK